MVMGCLPLLVMVRLDAFQSVSAQLSIHLMTGPTRRVCALWRKRGKTTVGVGKKESDRVIGDECQLCAHNFCLEMLSVSGLSCLLLLFDTLFLTSYTSAARISNDRRDDMNPPATSKPVSCLYCSTRKLV